jgi:hypothetical protein
MIKIQSNVPCGETASVLLFFLDDHSLGRLLVLHLLGLRLIPALQGIDGVQTYRWALRVATETPDWLASLIAETPLVLSHTIAGAAALHNTAAAGRAGVGRT